MAWSVHLSKRKCGFKQFPMARLIIEGHCDDRASVEYNLALGYRRAEVVRAALKAHIAEVTMQMVSLGRGSPLCSDMTEQCRQSNRRVHLTPVE
jgi:peptidoglycan-associated lipoprotein